MTYYQAQERAQSRRIARRVSLSTTANEVLVTKELEAERLPEGIVGRTKLTGKGRAER